MDAHVTQPEVRISRRKVYPRRLAFVIGTGPAWKWLYDVWMPDGAPVIEGTDLLSIARRKAREAARPLRAKVVCSWVAPSTDKESP